jgi:signal transduction histidine kinase
MVALRKTMQYAPNVQPTPVVLLVEDDKDLRQGTATVLQMAHYRVHTAADGVEALDLLRSGNCQPDIIVSDIKMPRMDGHELLDTIRQMPTLGPLPFIFLTAYGSEDHMRAAHESGVDEYLVKPFEPTRLVIVVRNKLRRAQELRRMAETELASAREHLVQLLSHELRTPMTALIGGMEILEEVLKLVQTTYAHDLNFSMDTIRGGIERLNRLSDQTVRYAELINGHARLDYDKHARPIPVSLLLEDAIEAVTPELQRKNVSLHVSSTLNPGVRVKALTSTMTTAIYEVLRNAARFNRVNGNIWIEQAMEGDYVAITVQDEGVGIPPEDLENIWNPMVQSNRHKQEQQGLGLGLPIARGTVRLHGGDITLESEQGRGTVVAIWLPVVRRVTS